MITWPEAMQGLVHCGVARPSLNGDGGKLFLIDLLVAVSCVPSPDVLICSVMKTWVMIRRPSHRHLCIEDCAVQVHTAAASTGRSPLQP